MSTTQKQKLSSAAKKPELWSTGQKQKLGLAGILFVAALAGSSTDYFLVLFVAAFFMALWGLSGGGKQG